MSLALLQSYSSAEEEEEGDPQQLLRDEFSSEDEADDAVPKTSRSYKPLFDPNPPSSSSLPSAFDAFSEVSGPPQFLNNSVQEDAVKEDGHRWRHGGRRNRKEKKDLPSEIREPEDISQDFKDRLEDLELVPEDIRHVQFLLSEEALFQAGLSSVALESQLLPPLSIRYSENPAVMADQRDMLDRLGDKRQRGRGRGGRAGPAAVTGNQRRRSAEDPVEHAPLSQRQRVQGGSQDSWPTRLRVPSSRVQEAPAAVQTAESSAEVGTYLGIHPDRAAAVDKWVGKRPKFLMDYCRSNSPTPSNMFQLPAGAREAMEIPARAWTPKMEEYTSSMSGTDLVTSAMALFGRGLDFLVKVNERAIVQEKELAEAGTKLDSFRSSLDLEKGRSASFQTRMEEAERMRAEMMATLQKERAEHQQVMEAAQKEAEERLQKAREESSVRAVADYKKSDEFRTYLNQVYALTYEDVIERLENEKPDYDIDFLRTALDEFKRAKGLKDDEDEVQIIGEGGDGEVETSVRAEETADEPVLPSPTDLTGEDAQPPSE